LNFLRIIFGPALAISANSCAAFSCLRVIAEFARLLHSAKRG
jgi:hypothetical protein